MTRTITWVAAALLALGACSKQSENPPSRATPAGSGSAMPAGSDPGTGSASAAGSGGAMPAGSDPGAGSASAAGSAGAAAAEADVPTEMDFEDDATARITDKTVEAEVKAIEKELADK